MTQLKLKRAYDPASPDDGLRVYIDKFWPQGLSHATFRYDAWEKGIAPSDSLRHWFHEDRDANWSAFASRYAAELEKNPDWPQFASSLSSHPVVTLLYSSKNRTENNAVVVLHRLVGDFPGKFKE